MSNEEEKLSPKQKSRRNFLGTSLTTAGAAITQCQATPDRCFLFT